MPPKDVVQSAAPRLGPYFATVGPTDGPIVWLDNRPALAVVDAPDSGRTIGTAHATRWVAHSQGRATLFRLVIRKTKLPGLWLRLGRRFVPLVEAAGKL
jgi:hypothetical protein